MYGKIYKNMIHLRQPNNNKYQSFFAFCTHGAEKSCVIGDEGLYDFMLRSLNSRSQLLSHLL